MDNNTILRIKVPAHLYESVKEQLTLKESKNRLSEAISGTEEELKAFYQKVKQIEAEGTDLDSAIEHALFDINNPDAAKELSTMNEAKKGKHNLGAGMELVKEKKNKIPKDGMKKMHNMNEVEQVEEGLTDDLGNFFIKVASNIKKGLGGACVGEYNAAIKAGKTHNEASNLYNSCLKRTTGRGSVVKNVVGVAEKKERTLDELKKAKNMLEMKIKKMEESLNEKKHEEEGE